MSMTLENVVSVLGRDALRVTSIITDFIPMVTTHTARNRGWWESRIGMDGGEGRGIVE